MFLCHIYVYALNYNTLLENVQMKTKGMEIEAFFAQENCETSMGRK